MNKRNLIDYFKILSDNEQPQAFLNEDFKFLDINKKYLEFFKFTEKELLEENFFIHFKHLDFEALKKIKNQFESYKSKDKFIYDQIELSLKNGKIKKIEFKFKFFSLQTDSFLMINFREINPKIFPKNNFYKNKNEDEQKKLKIQLNLMENFLNEQKNYISIVAHEISSPIGAITSLIEVLLDKTTDESEKKYYEMIHKSLDQVLNSGNNLLEIAKLDSENELKKESVEIISFLKEIIEQNTTFAYKKDISLVFTSSITEFFLDVMKDKFQYAISNLLNNAIKFSDEHTKVELVCEIKNSNLILKIIDEGIGISKEDEVYLFQKFTKAKKEGTQGEKSTGLGLYITKEILEKSGASISYEKNFPKGSKFIVRF